MCLFLTLVSLCSVWEAQGQTWRVPDMRVDAEDLQGLPASLWTETNYNVSVRLDSAVAAVDVSVPDEGEGVTVMTVYETDAVDTVGVWEQRSGTVRAMWLNSMQASYGEATVDYRSSTETGVLVHTMYYPRLSMSGTGGDTLFLGREGIHQGAKNFCSQLWFDGLLDGRSLRAWESVLAVRYGAVLHGDYVDRNDAVLWRSGTWDRAYSHAVCGIGRDDSLGLCQSQSRCRGDLATLFEAEPLDDLDYVMMGHDGKDTAFSQLLFVPAETAYYHTMPRTWRLRAHAEADSVSAILFFACTTEEGSEEAWLQLAGGGRTVLLPAIPVYDGFAVETFWLRAGEDYTAKLLRRTVAPEGHEPDGVGMASKSAGAYGAEPHSGGLQVSVSPNPTAGRYSVYIELAEASMVEVRVTDASGRIVERFGMAEPVACYRHEGVLPESGVYYVSVSSGDSRKTVKLIVAK